jgi:hypothetical protein
VAVEPRDGARRRLAAVVPGPAAGELLRLKIELERDGFAAGRRILIDKSLRRVAFAVENRMAGAHRTGLRISAPAGFAYEIVQGGQPLPLVATGDWDYPWRAEIEVSGSPVSVELRAEKGSEVAVSRSSSQTSVPA